MISYLKNLLQMCTIYTELLMIQLEEGVVMRRAFLGPSILANTLPVNINLPQPRSRTDTFIWNWSNKCPSYLVSRSNSGSNQKGWETLRCGLEQYFDRSQPANLPMGTWGRDSTRYLPCLTLRTNPFELKLIPGTTLFLALLLSENAPLKCLLNKVSFIITSKKMCVEHDLILYIVVIF